jgi:hypothetical protein
MSIDTLPATPRWRLVLDEQGRKIGWLADRTGLARQTVYSISMGRRRATEAWLDRVAIALDVPASWLKDDEAR